MDEIAVCPFCDSPSFKLIILSEDTIFCKACSRFFILTEKKFTCIKCGSNNIKNSDYPAPDGSVIFQCEKCKKMFTAKDLTAIQE